MIQCECNFAVPWLPLSLVVVMGRNLIKTLTETFETKAHLPGSKVIESENEFF